MPFASRVLARWRAFPLWTRVEIGIPGQALDRIFDEYFQFDNPARNIKKGLGLGLAIVKRLAKLLDHPIHVYSTEGKGSTFALDVPIGQKVVLTTATATAGPTHADRQLGVLFIDDDASVSDSLSLLLKAAGLTAVSAADGNEAIAQLGQGFRPDVVLSDYRMPNDNGLAVVARLRQALGDDTPAIVMTGIHRCAISRRIISRGSELLKSPSTRRC